MRPETITRGRRNRFECKLLAFLLMVCLTGLASVSGATYSIPAARSVTWEGNAGVQGDIPSRTVIYTTLSPSGDDDASAIQTAINNCPFGQVVELNAGMFKVRSPISVKSGVTLRGAGMGITIIQGMSGMSGAFVVGIGAGSTLGPVMSLTAGINAGSTTIATSSEHGWTPGNVILIDQLNDHTDDPPVSNIGNNGECTWCGRLSGTRSLGQTVKILTTPTPNTATLEIPLYWNYDPNLSPQALSLNGLTTMSGVENLTVDNSLSGVSSQKSTVLLSGTSNCWVSNTEVIGSYQSILGLNYGVYRNTIRGCKLHEGIPTTAGDGSSSFAPNRGYGISSHLYSSANLIENNQIYHLSTGIASSGPFSGNVMSYNYISSLYINAIDFNPYAITFHGSHAFMNLIEENYIDSRVASDYVWGTKSHNTLFRNKLGIAPNRARGAWDVDIQYYSRYFNIVGNVIGRGTEGIYALENMDSNASAIYRFGYNGDGDRTAVGNDAGVGSTILRHGNWDSYTNGVVWNGTDDRHLPNSLYLRSKPSWWGTLQWPAIGPDVSPMFPAALGVGNGTPWDTSKVITSPHLNPASPSSLANSVTLTWDAPTTYTDGTPIATLGGYIIGTGTASGSYSQIIDVGNVTSYTLSSLVDGTTYYFAVKAYDTSGIMSLFSNEESYTTPAPPGWYTITASAGTGGAISPAGSVTVNSGGSQTFAITPDGGYQIAAVSVDGVSVGAVSSYTFINVTANYIISVTFINVQADLSIIKSSDKATYAKSDLITYSITVNNYGPSDAHDVIVTDNLPLPQQATYLSNTGGCTKFDNVLTCNLGTIEVGQSKSFNVTETAKRGTVTNSAKVTSSTIDPNSSNNSSTRVVTITK